MSEYLSISDAAKEVQVESHVLRYWEDELKLSIHRNELGHRVFTKEDIEKTLKPELYVGRAPYQVEVYLRDVVKPVLEANKDELGATAEINV